MSKKAAKGGHGKPTIIGAIQHVLIASMNKGQFPIAVMALVIIVMIWRMPEKDVTQVAMKIIDHLAVGHLWGHIVAIILAILWMVHARWQRRIAASEFDRMGREKTKIQEQALKGKLSSSEKKR